MKCPKCKKGRIKRLRTYDRGTFVERENKCSLPKCNHRFNTIELTDVDRNKELMAAAEEVRKAQDEQHHAEYQQELVLDAVDVLIEAATERHAKKFPNKKRRR